MAQHNLGYCYFNDLGVAQDQAEAAKWFRKAADQGYVKAQCDLGACYFNGSGVAKDEVEGAKWYRKAADRGHDLAQFELGVCYRNGEGVARNEVEAYAYFNLAGITFERARENLAILEKGMSPDARTRGQQRTKELQKEIEAKQAGK
jgi:TPR repeat protein